MSIKFLFYLLVIYVKFYGNPFHSLTPASHGVSRPAHSARAPPDVPAVVQRRPTTRPGDGQVAKNVIYAATGERSGRLRRYGASPMGLGCEAAVPSPTDGR